MAKLQKTGNIASCNIDASLLQIFLPYKLLKVYVLSLS
jgi:hypothetical protein